MRPSSIQTIEVYVAEISGEPVACLSIDDAWLRTLYVLPEHWSRGVGSMLLEQNEAARRFYEHRGWRLTGETRIVPFPPYPIDVCYSLDLTP